jgi:hypothetical protein
MCDCLRHAMATATSGYRGGYCYERLQGDGRDDSEAHRLDSEAEVAWIRRGSGEDSREVPRSETGVEALPGSARDLRRGLSPTTWTLWRWEGGWTFARDGAGARRLGWVGEERER